MRILNLMLGQGRGGLEHMAQRYHVALASRGFQVLSVARRGGWFADIADLAIGGGALGGFGLSLGLGTAVAGFRPNVVVCHGTRALRIARQTDLRGAWLAFVAHNFRFKPEMARADLVLCGSEAVRRDFVEHFPFANVRLLENFSRLQVSAPREAPRPIVRIGALGRLHDSKGYDLLIRAAALLAERGVDFRLVIGGDGPDRPLLEAIVAEAGLAEVVSMPGWVDDGPAFLAGLDVFVQSSRVEAFGLSMLEAMAAGTPIVATAVGGPALILDGGLGALVPPEDPPALAEALIGAIRDWPASRARAEAAQREAVRRFTLEAGASGLAEAMNALAGEAPAVAPAPAPLRYSEA